jgi:hypothetical protein
MNFTSVPMGGRAPPQKSRRGLQDRIRPPQLTVLPLQLHQPTPIITRHPRPGAGIDLGLLHPAAQRIPVDTQLLPNPTTRAGHRQLQLIIGQNIIDQTDRPITNLRRILLRC